jgi:hypothetical protein
LVKLALGLYEHKDIPMSAANINEEDGHKIAADIGIAMALADK